MAGGCFAVLRYYREGNAGALTSLVALLSCAALVGVDALRREAPYQRAGALAIASLGSFWIARYAGLENPQWYVALPALALLWDGYALRRRDRQAARALSGVGLALVLGTTAVQLADGGTDDGLSTATLVVESVAALLVGVALRQRVYVLAGAAGVAVAALRALLMLLSQIPLFAVFGVAALLLLGLAALLAFLRERLGRAVTGTAASTWADWD